MITMAERRFPVRVRLGVPPGGLGRRHTHITDWLDENCGSDSWAMTPSGLRGVLNDAISVYFADATLASAFVDRWCAGSKVETAGGVFRVREDEPSPRGGAASDAVNEITLRSETSRRETGSRGQQVQVPKRNRNSSHLFVPQLSVGIRGSLARSFDRSGE